VFSPPANLTDFDAIPNQPETWHTAIAALTRETVRSVEAEVGAGSARYHDPSAREVGRASLPRQRREATNPGLVPADGASCSKHGNRQRGTPQMSSRGEVRHGR
jgi:hypothetical protein